MAPSLEVDLCGLCKKIVNENDFALQCEGKCGLWFHTHCLRINKSKYNSIVNLENVILWFCETCKQDLAEGYKCNCSIPAGSQTGNNNSSTTLNEINEKLIKLEDNNEQLTHLIRNLISKLQVSMESSGHIDLRSLRPESSQPDTFATVLKSAPVPKETYSVVNYTRKPNADVSTTRNRNFPKRNFTGKVSQHDQQYNAKTISSNQSPGDKSFSKEEKDEEGFTKVCYHKKTSDLRKVATNKTNTLITGKGSSNQLLVANKVAWAYVTRFQVSVSECDIKSYIESNCGIKNSVCEKLPTRHNSYNSFKIGVSQHQLCEVMKPDIWPEGILIGKYFPKRHNVINSSEKNNDGNDFLAMPVSQKQTD